MKKTVCQYCGKEISNSNIKKHLNSHENNPNYFIQIGKQQSLHHEGLTCIYCGKDYKNKNSLAQHECRCKLNPNRIDLSYLSNNERPQNGHIAWNKGLTKETDERVAKQANKYIEGLKSGRNKTVSRSSDPEVRKKLSIKAKQNILSGKVIPINHSKAKHGWYKGYYCDSSWELAYVIYNLEHDIIFNRNKDFFEYEYEGSNHLYFPDFMLADGSYVEIKGHTTQKDKIKWLSFPKDKKLIVIDKNTIDLYLNYVINKYGVNFYYLYEK